MTNPFDLTGRTAMVTGANAGIGRAIALALAAAGADLVAVGRSSCQAVAAEARAIGRRAVPLHADLSTIAPVERLIADAAVALGPVDILVNNAGIIRRSDAVDFSERDWDEVIDTNLKSAFFLAQAAGRAMIARGGGKIVNIASMLSFQGGIRVASYAASKSAIAGITKALANEWAGKGVNVNAIAPGYIATRNTEKLRSDPERSDAILARIPAGRWGRPDDVAGAAVFLASPAADYVHGHVLAVDGGWLAR
jgi:2-deoxy-D-gluconate 3-dehydrogenase